MHQVLFHHGFYGYRLGKPATIPDPMPKLDGLRFFGEDWFRLTPWGWIMQDPKR